MRVQHKALRLARTDKPPQRTPPTFLLKWASHITSINHPSFLEKAGMACQLIGNRWLITVHKVDTLLQRPVRESKMSPPLPTHFWHFLKNHHKVRHLQDIILFFQFQHKWFQVIWDHLKPSWARNLWEISATRHANSNQATHPIMTVTQHLKKCHFSSLASRAFW